VEHALLEVDILDM
jgi:hypothetical protein